MFGHHSKLSSVPVPDGSVINIKDIPEDVPQFKREYTAQIHGRATIEVKITIKTYNYGSSKMGELTQPNGGWVFFDPDRVAEKILDPILVPQVQAVVDQVYELDKQYRHPGPNSFKDERGTTWVRAA